MRSRDKYFLTCKIVTLLLCLPWPLTLVASVMSLAGEFSAGTPMAIRVLVRVGWLLALVYPVVFFAMEFFAERVLAAKNYALGAVVAALPAIAGIMACLWIWKP
ncbi:MAG TPA: hypothetical protein VN780_12735 [Candidatus Eisenbacteria bacterium]|nr:hypothetical protein [Candidatus Eisenbacteria bacterium]